jgi:hypothetical protein
MNLLLMASSTLLLLPALHAWEIGHMPLCIANAHVLVSSWAYHSQPWPKPLVAYWWDQAGIFSVWGLSAYYTLSTLSGVETLPFWLSTAYFGVTYYVGRLTRSMAFGPREHEWHATIHLVAAIGTVLMQQYLAHHLTPKETIDVQ